MPKKSSEAKKLPPYDLKAHREKREMSQSETAKFFFTNQSTVARWEQDGDTPPLARAYWELYWRTNKQSSRAKKAQQ